MANKHYQSYCLVKRFCRSGWYASVVGLLMIPAIAMGATPSANQAVVKQLALNAYCSEAQSKSTSMANGSISYERIAELAPFVDAAGRFGRSVAANSAGERELLEETLHPFHIFSLVRIDLGVGPLEVALGQDRRGPVTRAGNVDRVQVVLVDKPVEVDVGVGGVFRL